MCESFFATLECELIDRLQPASDLTARRGGPSFSSSKASTTRPVATRPLGYLSPIEYERKHDGLKQTRLSPQPVHQTGATPYFSAGTNFRLAPTSRIALRTALFLCGIRDCRG